MVDLICYLKIESVGSCLHLKLFKMDIAFKVETQPNDNTDNSTKWERS